MICFSWRPRDFHADGRDHLVHDFCDVLVGGAEAENVRSGEVRGRPLLDSFWPTI